MCCGSPDRCGINIFISQHINRVNFVVRSKYRYRTLGDRTAVVLKCICRSNSIRVEYKIILAKRKAVDKNVCLYIFRRTDILTFRITQVIRSGYSCRVNSLHRHNTRRRVRFRVDCCINFEHFPATFIHTHKGCCRSGITFRIISDPVPMRSDTPMVLHIFQHLDSDLL